MEGFLLYEFGGLIHGGVYFPELDKLFLWKPWSSVGGVTNHENVESDQLTSVKFLSQEE